ncbi:hypothetical protein ACFYNY_32555 [Streptomyces sp. NPDC006530]|uniref:hypothetical protein n=1 Tax=Streptomyces sp. NPDC006530 TaxID=3364750 RepID=UPI0036B52BE2
MDTALRHAAVLALGELGRSRDFQDRADAGRGLAAFAETPEAFALLLDLVLDPHDTFVTRVTTEAVLRRKDRSGLAIVAYALADAGPNHSDWIRTAIDDVLSIFSVDRDHAMRLCAELSTESDDRLARGVGQLHGILAEMDPVLRP